MGLCARGVRGELGDVYALARYCTPSNRSCDTISSKVRRLKDLLNGCKVHIVERESDEGEGYSKQCLK